MINLVSRSGSSTQDALLSVTNAWQQSLSSNHQVGTVFFDISKAFDSVPHDRILASLARVGVGGSLLKWFTDYLRGRSQCVAIDVALSSPSPVTSGDPQGSILGPLLFSIFMDSITQLPLSPNSKLILYADDILLSKPINNNQDVLDLQVYISIITEWAKENGLLLNTSKSAVLPITRFHNPIPLCLHADNKPILVVDSFKYFVTISSHLSWSSHIWGITRAAK